MIGLNCLIHSYLYQRQKQNVLTGKTSREENLIFLLFSANFASPFDEDRGILSNENNPGVNFWLMNFSKYLLQHSCFSVSLVYIFPFISRSNYKGMKNIVKILTFITMILKTFIISNKYIRNHKCLRIIFSYITSSCNCCFVLYCCI